MLINYTSSAVPGSTHLPNRGLSSKSKDVWNVKQTIFLNRAVVEMSEILLCLPSLQLLDTVFMYRNKFIFLCSFDRLCGLVVRVPGYRSRWHGFDSRRYQIFWEVVGLERGPLSLVGTIEELLRRNSSGSGLENRECSRGDPLRWPRETTSIRKSWH
jgi:hypothetical protein